MKSSMKKFFVTCAAVSAVSVCAAASAMAADFTTAPAYSDDDTNTVTIVIPAEIDAAKQATVLVVPKDAVNDVTDEDILYINQGLTNEAGMTTLKLKGTEKLDDGSYTVKFGGYIGETFTLYSGDFTVGDVQPSVKYGDIDNDNKITSSDAMIVRMSEVGLFTLDDNQKVIADVSDDNRVDSTDALAIQMYEVKLLETFPAESK